MSLIVCRGCLDYLFVKMSLAEGRETGLRSKGGGGPVVRKGRRDTEGGEREREMPPCLLEA
eukprot:15460920-Alexandrium_andersonii.AAC.1